MKKVFILAALCLSLTACAPSNQALYEQAQRYLGAKSYALAEETFMLLGEYAQAGQYAIYCRALQALEKEEWVLAEADFDLVFDFKLAKLYSGYAAARQQEAAGEMYDAQSAYARLGSLLDSQSRAAHLGALIPDTEYAAAKTLYAIGEYERAMAAFLALADYRDSAAMAAACQSVLSEKAAVIPAAKAEEARFAKIQDQMYYVISLEEHSAVLLSKTIQTVLPVLAEGEIDAGLESSSLQTYLNTTFKNTFSPEVQAAINSISLPDKAFCQSLTIEQRMAFVPDALMQYEPLVSSLQNGAWWLSDAGTLANTRSIVYYNGVIYDKGLPATDARIGVRPLITLNTALLPFKQGTGTEDDPLR